MAPAPKSRPLHRVPRHPRAWWICLLASQALVAWAVGVAAYHFMANVAPELGATLPALLLAGVLHGLLSLSRGQETARA